MVIMLKTKMTFSIEQNAKEILDKRTKEAPTSNPFSKSIFVSKAIIEKDARDKEDKR